MLHFINDQFSHTTQEGLVTSRFFAADGVLGSITAVPNEELVRVVTVSPPNIIDLHEGDLPAINAKQAGRHDRFTARVNHSRIAAAIVGTALQINTSTVAFVHNQ